MYKSIIKYHHKQIIASYCSKKLVAAFDFVFGSSDQTAVFLGFGIAFTFRSCSNESTNEFIDVPLLGLIDSRDDSSAACAAARRPFLADYKKHIIG